MKTNRRSKNMKLLAFIAAAAGLVIFQSCNNNTETAENTEVEQTTVDSHAAAADAMKLPAFAVQDQNGNTLNLESFSGKKVFVNLWASWCPPCRREMPSIEKLYQDTDKNKVAFVMLALDDQFQKSLNYISSAKLDLPVYYPAENLPSLFNVQGIPATFIFNEKGELIKRIDGSADYDTQEYRDLLQ